MKYDSCHFSIFKTVALVNPEYINIFLKHVFSRLNPCHEEKQKHVSLNLTYL